MQVIKILFYVSGPAPTGCPTKHDSWWIVLNVFFHNLLSCLIPKKIKKNIWHSFDFKVNHIWVKEFFNEINSVNSSIYNIIYGRRHSKLFTNCHVSWDTLYYLSQCKLDMEKVKFMQHYTNTTVWSRISSRSDYTHKQIYLVS